MIPFLTKLANLLDERGQHKMAKEIDDLIEKLAQMSSIDQNQSTMADAPLNMSVMPEVQSEPLQSIQPLAPAGEAAKAPTHKKSPKKKNPLIEQLQLNIGMKPTGFWDKATDQKFLDVMSAYPEYSKMIVNNKFKGTLQDAVRLTSQLAILNTPQAEEMASKVAPVQPPVKQEDDFETPGQKMWKSKYFKLTPEAMMALRTLDQKRGPGAGQRLIDLFDRTPGQTQETFEEILKDRAAQS